MGTKRAERIVNRLSEQQQEAKYVNQLKHWYKAAGFAMGAVSDGTARSGLSCGALMAAAERLERVRAKYPKLEGLDVWQCLDTYSMRLAARQLGDANKLLSPVYRKLKDVRRDLEWAIETLKKEEAERGE